MGFSKLVVTFLFCFLILIIEGCWRSEGCLEHEKFALLQLRHFFNDPLSLRNWVDDANNLDCCQWERIECSNTTRRVISIDLGSTRNWESIEKSYLNASLFIPFQQLEHLSLDYNKIIGCVENEGLEKLSKLSNLKYLNLGGNYFNNNILSSIGDFLSVRKLYLYDNRLKGSINVKELDFLISLEELDMSFNEIQDLVVPKDYRGLRKLKSLYLLGVEIKGGSKLIKSMESFPSLKTLSLSYNDFTETVTVTQELPNFTNLEELTLDETSLDISLLKSVGAFTSLKHLSMQQCEINGVVFGEELHNFTNLEELKLDDTSIHRSLLQSLAAFTSLKHLSMKNCELNGVLFDKGLCDLVHLQELFISFSNLIGTLPSCLANMTSLRILDVSSNQLKGKISSSPLIHLTSIEELYLSNNNFQIPISLEPFFNHSKLKSFKGGSNELYSETESHSLAPKFQLNTIDFSGHGKVVGTFPKFLYHQHELQGVDISHVNLTGEFPNWLLENNTKLESLYLVNNSLSGPLHLPIHPHRKLSTLDVCNNKLLGNIPTEIGAYLPNLTRLNFCMNDFDGSIPSSFGDMKFLERLYLSHNHLTGEIPKNLAMNCFNLKLLMLSNNNLQGHLFF